MCDYVPTLYSVIFPAGVTQVSFNINITDDELFEGPETFNVAILSGALPRSVNVGNHVRATVTIVDNEKCKSIFILLHVPLPHEEFCTEYHCRPYLINLIKFSFVMNFLNMWLDITWKVA